MPKPKFERHSLSAIFPEANDDDFAAIRKSIRTYGFHKHEPVMFYQDKVLDGWNRYRAALEEGIKEADIPTMPFRGKDPIEYVLTKNLARRQMTNAQRSAAAVKLIEVIKTAEAAEKHEADEKAKKAKAKGDKPAATPAKPARSKGDKTKAAAKALGVSPRSVAAAAKVKKNDPAAFKAIEEGKSSVNEATKGVDAKLTAAEREGKQFEEAAARVDKVCGENFSKVAAKKLNTKEILKLSNLEKDEMLRVKPFIESGWTLKMALGYKSIQLTHGHNIRQLLDRATANGGHFTLEIDDYIVEVKKAKK